MAKSTTRNLPVYKEPKPKFAKNCTPQLSTGISALMF